MNRLLIFVHFNPHNDIENHVIYTLREMKPLFAKTIFVTNSPMNNTVKERISGLYDEFISRENIGYDFAAWRDAFLEVSWNKVKKYDSVTIMNDTCFGPIYPLAPMYKKMEAGNVDFWGNYAHPATRNSMPDNNGPVPRHIQSYFQVFSRKVVESKVFRDFWEHIENYTDVRKIIQNYETRLTGILEKGGFKCKTLVPYQPTLPANAMTDAPDKMIELGSPFVKIKAFDLFYKAMPNRPPDYIIREIQSVSDYPVEYICEFFNHNMLRPASDILLFDRFVSASDRVARDYGNMKVAIYIHAFYTDVFARYLDLFTKIKFPFDLFITTNTEAKIREIKKIAKTKGIKNIREIKLTPNKGRDILPWLSLADKLNKYDIVGKFHTKKSTDADPVVGQMWQEDLWASLLERPEKIINEFRENSNVGIIIPDIPTYFRRVPPTVLSEGLLRPTIKKAWSKMQLKKYDFNQDDIYIFALGNMFWYRPKALLPLTTIHLEDKEVPNEPLVGNAITILHALERLPVYIARDQGYFFRIAKMPSASSAFIDHVALNKVIHLHHIAITTASKIPFGIRIREIYRDLDKSPAGRFIAKPVHRAVGILKDIRGRRV